MFTSCGGFQVSIAMNGPSCLEQIEQAAKKGMLPHVLLLDYMMPGMSGLDVCKALRKQFSALELPIIMLTCKTAPEDMAAALKTGVNDYVKKPFNQIELVARVRKKMELMTERTKLMDSYNLLNGEISRLKAELKKVNNLKADSGTSHKAASTRGASTADIEALKAENATLRRQKDAAEAAAASGAHAPLSQSVASAGSDFPEGPGTKALRERIRELEREARKYRAELAASKAKLDCVTEDSEEMWQRLADAEEQAAASGGGLL